MELASVDAVVDAIDAAACAFHEEYNFLERPTRRLLLPMGTIKGFVPRGR